MINISIDTKQAQRLLKDTEKRINAATRMALNDTARHARTEAGRQVRQVWNLSAARTREEIKTNKLASSKDLKAIVQVKGRPISLVHFGAKARRGNVTTTARKSVRGKRRLKNQGVTVQIMRGRNTYLPKAFIANVRAGRTSSYMGVFQRYGLSRLPIRNMASVGVPTMVKQERVWRPLMQSINDRLRRRVDHHLKRLGV